MRYRIRARRDPRPDQFAYVSFTGTARTVAWISQAIASVAVVTAMRRRVLEDGTICVDITCHRPAPDNRHRWPPSDHCGRSVDGPEDVAMSAVDVTGRGIDKPRIGPERRDHPARPAETHPCTVEPNGGGR